MVSKYNSSVTAFYSSVHMTGTDLLLIPSNHQIAAPPFIYNVAKRILFSSKNTVVGVLSCENIKYFSILKILLLTARKSFLPS